MKENVPIISINEDTLAQKNPIKLPILMDQSTSDNIFFTKNGKPIYLNSGINKLINKCCISNRERIKAIESFFFEFYNS